MKRCVSMMFPAAAIALLATSCGNSVGAGGHVMYLVAADETQYEGDSCPQQNDPNHTSTIRTGGKVIIFATPGDPDPVFYLDRGIDVLEGSQTDDGYEFSGNVTQTNDIGNGTTVTITTDAQVTVVLDGSSMTGTLTTDDTTSCKGPDCGGAKPTKCHTSTDFTGVELDESVSVD